MGHYAEARSHKQRKGRELDHLRVHASQAGDAHVIAHHFDDGSVEHYEFAHPAQNMDALVHLIKNAGMDPNNMKSQESEDQ